MSNGKKTAKDVKGEVLIILDSYISGFEGVEPDDRYFDGYRAALKTVREGVEKVEIPDDDKDEKRNSKVTLL